MDNKKPVTTPQVEVEVKPAEPKPVHLKIKRGDPVDWDSLPAGSTVEELPVNK